MNALQAFSAAFDVAREPRSQEYRDGALRVLQMRLDGAAVPRCPFPMGTARADAWYAGVEEGHRLARGVLEAKSCG